MLLIVEAKVKLGSITVEKSPSRSGSGSGGIPVQPEVVGGAAQVAFVVARAVVRNVRLNSRIASP